MESKNNKNKFWQLKHPRKSKHINLCVIFILTIYLLNCFVVVNNFFFFKAYIKNIILFTWKRNSLWCRNIKRAVKYWEHCHNILNLCAFQNNRILQKPKKLTKILLLMNIYWTNKNQTIFTIQKQHEVGFVNGE